MKVFLRYFCFCALSLVLLSFIYNYTNDVDYALIEKEVATEDSLALRDLENFKQGHGKDRKAWLFYYFMRVQLFTQKGKEVSLDSVEAWVAEAKETGDSLLYAKSLETLSACHAVRGELSQALSAQQYACDVTYKADAASALHEHHLIALFAAILCLAIALCLTFLHLYRRERMGKQHTERRLILAKRQLQLSTQNSEQFLYSIQELRKKIEGKQDSSSEASLSEIGERMTNEMISFKKQQISLSLISLNSSDIAERFRKSITDRRIKISEKDWNSLIELFSQQLPQLITILQTNGLVTANERRICMFTLLDMGTLEIGAILNLQSSSVSSAKKALLVKLTDDVSVSAKELKTKIISMLATL